MKTNSWKALILAGITTVFAAGCASTGPDAPHEIYPPVPPPPAPAQIDLQTPAPGPDYVWIGGAWAYQPVDGWTWEKSHWNRPPRKEAVWVPHHYEYRDGKHVFVAGHWQ